MNDFVRRVLQRCLWSLCANLALATSSPAQAEPEATFALRDYEEGTAIALSSLDYDVTLTPEYGGVAIRLAHRNPPPEYAGDWQLRFRADSRHGFSEGVTIQDEPRIVPDPENGVVNVGLAQEALDDQQASGEFTVHELKWGTAGEITALRVTFRCNRRLTLAEFLPKVGEIRYHASPRLPNAPPEVQVGLPQYLAGTLATQLVTQVTDDALPLGNPLAIAWTVQSGPGEVTFSNKGPRTRAVFSKPGAYVLRYTASDGEFTTSRDVPVVLGSRPETYHGHVLKDGLPYALVQFNVRPSGTFTGAIVIGPFRIPLAGALAAEQWSKPGKGKSLAFELQRAEDHSAISGWMMVGRDAFKLDARQDARAFLEVTGTASPYRGPHTWLTDLPGDQEPFGHSYGRAIVDAAGRVRFTGRLASGRSLTCSTAIALDEAAAVYWEAPSREQFRGTLRFSQVEGRSRFEGEMPWARVAPRFRTPPFPDGFELTVAIHGESYTPTASAVNPLNQAPEDSPIWCSARALSWSGPVRSDGILQRSGLVNGPAFSLRVDSKTGLFTGTILDPSSKRRTVGGALLQQSRLGGGAFTVKDGLGVIDLGAR